MKKIIPFLVCVLVALVGCEKNEPSPYKVETGNVYNITQTTATIDGVLQIDITDYNTVNFGVMYATSRDDISNYTAPMQYVGMLNGTDFSVDLTGLTEDTKYYYCAFLLLNNTQYELGEIKEFTTLESEKTPDKPDTPIVPEEPKPSGSHEYVDLGLPSGTLWATCNVGASTPEDYGDYFAWGETEPKSPDYTINNYKWSLNGDHQNMTKYCTDANLGELDNKIVLELEDDAAHVNWGGDWRMPTKEQIQELLEECTYEGTTQKGVCGILITSKTNGNSIFMPAGGYRSLFSNYINQHCVYWSSSLNTNDSRRAYNLVSSLDETSLYVNYNRYYGLLIRPVMSKK